MAVTLSSERLVHILDGDHTGGGHRHECGKGKSEFPASWSDGQIVRAVLSIANDPGMTGIRRGRRRVIEGKVKGLDIRVVIEDEMSVITAYPC